MSTLSGYKTKAFSESQKFFVLDPNTGSPALVLGSDLVNQLTPNSNYVFSESTRSTAQATDYPVGSLIQTAGATSEGDNLSSAYLVVPAGEGDFPMDNGNELLVIAGDDALRALLISNASGEGSDLVAHTGTENTVTETLDQNTSAINQRTIYVGSVAELEALSLAAGTNVYLTASGRAGDGTIKSGTAPADPQNGIYITLANGNYWERNVDGPWNPLWFGIDPDSADNAPAWSDMLAMNPPHVHYSKPGTYTFLSSTEHDQDIVITGNSSVVIDCTDAGFAGDFWTKITGSISALPDLSATAGQGARSVTFASDPGLSPDDVFIIHNPTPSSWSGFRPDYCAGEYCRVVSVSGNTVTIAGELYDSYAPASVDIYKLSKTQASVGGGFKINGNLSLNLLEFKYCRNVFVNNANIYHQNNAAIVFDKCFNVQVQDPVVHNTGDGGDDYGISIANSQHVKVFGGNVFSRRHSITTGGDQAVVNVPCRDIRIIGATLSNDINSGTHNADFHGNTEDSSYENCEIYGGATWQGKNVGYINCRIGSLAVGVCILSSEILGGTFYAKGCKFHTVVDPSDTSRGVIDVGGNSNVLTANTVEDVYLDAIDNELLGGNFSNLTSFMLFRNAGTEVRVNPTIDGLSMNVDDIGHILLTNLDAGTARSYRTIVQNIKDNGLADGKQLVNHIGGHYLNFPHKLQRQDGYETLTTSTSAESVTSNPITFKWSYPRVPSVNVSRNNRSYIGNRIGVPYAISLDGDSMGVAIATDDGVNFTSANTVQLHWQAEIAEV